MLQIAIVENDITTSSTIINICKNYITNHFTRFKTFNSYEELLQDSAYVKQTNILISNIHTEDEVEQVNLLKTVSNTIQVIFYSAQLEIAPLLYDLQPIYFIYKKQLQANLYKALQRFMDIFERQDQKKLAIFYNSKIQIIPVQDILYIERVNRQVRIQTKDYEFYCYLPFDQIMDSLKNCNFIRTHISYFVKIDSVAEYNGDHFILKNNEYIPISRRYKKAVQETFYK